MSLFSRTPLTPAQQAEKDREKAAKERLKAQRAREAAAWRAQRAEQERERVANFPHFVVRETREVTVQAETMNDAIALASAAFKEGQNSDHSIKWHKPFGVDGDTIDEIRVTGIKTVKIPPYDD